MMHPVGPDSMPMWAPFTCRLPHKMKTFSFMKGSQVKIFDGGVLMFRELSVVLGFCVFSSAIARAQPQTVSYYAPSICGGQNPCDVVPVLPVQGFVLTDIVCPYGLDINLWEVDGQTEEAKLLAKVGQSHPFEYHFNSGMPFGGGLTLRAGGDAGIWCTYMGYIPGTGTGSVPAVGSMGLALIVLLLLGLGGALIRRKRDAMPGSSP